jgi:hypothetical protein
MPTDTQSNTNRCNQSPRKIHARTERDEVVHPDRFVSETYPCDPLVVKFVVEDMCQSVTKSGGATPVHVSAGGDSISAVAGQVSCLVSSITEHEAKLTTVVDVMNCCNLPVLASPSVQEQFAKSSIPFEVKVYEAGGCYVPLENLTRTFSGCENRTLDDRELAKYIIAGGDEEFLWYWEDGVCFNPYGTSVSERLEEGFRSKETVVLLIGPYNYEVDTLNMTQTNTNTSKVRQVQRRQIPGTATHNIFIQVRTHSDHLDEVRSTIVECMSMKEITVSLPPFGRDTASIKHLLDIARKGFVFAQKSETDDAILLRGRQDVVMDIELKLTKEILRKQVEMVKVKAGDVTRPKFWEPQESVCELKLVSKGTLEWSTVEQLMTRSKLRVNVLRIERIQNQWLWEVYDRSQKRVSEKNRGQVNERCLFHGSRLIPPVKIYKSEQGFDNRLSSRGMWGVGAYFAKGARYSDAYAYITPEGHKQMFIVRVITGISYKCPPDSSLKAPPKKADHPASSYSSGGMFEDERYDSVCGTAQGSEIYVIYEHGKVYPAYLITYT